jgi:translation initiation factor IF-3
VSNRILSNEEIYGYSVVVIDQNGVNKGEMIKKQAIYQAREIGLDLVQVAKTEKGLPICKFADAGKLKFEASKKRPHVKATETKEMMFHLRTGIHDIQIKKNKIRSMLAKKCLVKFGIELKGREKSFMNNAKEMLANTVQDLSDVAQWDTMQSFPDSVFYILRPSKDHAQENKTSDQK